jgi:hypothetical protein
MIDEAYILKGRVNIHPNTTLQCIILFIEEFISINSNMYSFIFARR